MKPKSSRGRFLLLAGLLAAAAARARAEAPNLGLAGYTLEQGPLTIEGPAENCSGLAFDRLTRTLWIAVNKPPLLLELDLAGKTLRRVELSGFDDTEDVAWVNGRILAVVEERRRTICQFELAPQAPSVSYAKAVRWLLDPEDAANFGPEGLAWDAAGKRFWAVKEKTPRRIYVLAPPVAKGKAPAVSAPWDVEQQSFGCGDLSGIAVHAGSGHVLLLSDESKCVVEVTAEGREVDRLRLQAGHAGLVRDVPQPEGIVLDDAGRLYICSEPNELYIFAPPQAAGAAATARGATGGR